MPEKQGTEKEDAPDDKPAAIGGLVGVLAGKKDDGTLEALTDAGVKISGLTMEGSIMGILPAPYAEASLNVQAEGGHYFGVLFLILAE